MTNEELVHLAAVSHFLATKEELVSQLFSLQLEFPTNKKLTPERIEEFLHKHMQKCLGEAKTSFEILDTCEKSSEIA